MPTNWVPFVIGFVVGLGFAAGLIAAVLFGAFVESEAQRKDQMLDKQ